MLLSQAGRCFSICLSTHPLSVLFPIVNRLPSELLFQQDVTGVPLVPAAASRPGSGSDPQEPHELCQTLGTLCLSPFPAPVSEQALLCSSPWCLAGGQPPPRVPPWQLPAQVLPAHPLLQGCLETWLEGRDLCGHSSESGSPSRGHLLAELYFSQRHACSPGSCCSPG